jgi:uncharacterized protein (TIGR00730 family)
MTLRNLCVYCGSNLGRNPIYVEQARALACALVERRIGLVFGGAHVGVMGVIADTVLEAGGVVTGVIPQSLVDKEVAHMGLTELVVTESMHERKMIMAERSDGFIALPGGIGTLEELFEVWTWAQLGFHRKPCGILNVAGYYDGLARFLDHTVAENFVKTPHREMLFVETDPAVLLDSYEQYTPPNVEKWLRRAEM